MKMVHLKPHQIRTFHINKLGISEILKQEKDIEFEVLEDGSYLLRDLTLNKEFVFYTISEYFKEDQFQIINKKFKEDDNLKNLILDFPPCLTGNNNNLKKRTIENPEQAMNEMTQAFYKEWKFDHHIDNSTFNNFFEQSLLDEEQFTYNEDKKLFITSIGGLNKEIDLRASIMGIYLQEKEKEQQYSVINFCFYFLPILDQFDWNIECGELSIQLPKT